MEFKVSGSERKKMKNLLSVFKEALSRMNINEGLRKKLDTPSVIAENKKVVEKLEFEIKELEDKLKATHEV